MIEAIRERVVWIQEQLWEVAIHDFQLARTPETVARIKYTIDRVVRHGAIKIGYEMQSPKPADGQLEPVDEGLALAFMTVCVTEATSDCDEALKMLVVAAEALGSVTAVARLRGDPGESSTKLAASSMARARHAENYALKNAAIKHWRENIPQEMSAQKAATELIRVVPLSHKKLAELVSAEKKKTS